MDKYAIIFWKLKTPKTIYSYALYPKNPAKFKFNPKEIVFYNFVQPEKINYCSPRGKCLIFTFVLRAFHPCKMFEHTCEGWTQVVPKGKVRPENTAFNNVHTYTETC